MPSSREPHPCLLFSSLAVALHAPVWRRKDVFAWGGGGGWGDAARNKHKNSFSCHRHCGVELVCPSLLASLPSWQRIGGASLCQHISCSSCPIMGVSFSYNTLILSFRNAPFTPSLHKHEVRLLHIGLGPHCFRRSCFSPGRSVLL